MVESCQCIDLSSLVTSTSMSLLKDRWCWSLNSSGEFSSVASVIFLIDKLSLSVFDRFSLWNNLVPIKVYVMVWRLSLNRLPVRNNLVNRGVEIDSLLCLICGDFFGKFQSFILLLSYGCFFG